MTRERFPKNSEGFGPSVPQAVIIMFPDARTTDGARQDFHGYYKETLVEKFLETTQKLLKRYKREGYKIFGVVYEDTAGHFSYLYPEDQFDRLISIGMSLAGWTPEKFKQELPNTIKSLNLEPGAKVVIGGYHAGDCVANMVGKLKGSGYTETAVDLLLTNELPFLLISHRIRAAMLAKGERKEHMATDRLIWQNIKEETEEQRGGT